MIVALAFAVLVIATAALFGVRYFARDRGAWLVDASGLVVQGLIAAAPKLLAAAKMQEAAELNRPMDCEECGGEGKPEACGSCFPPFDEARIARRAAIAEAEGATDQKDADGSNRP